MYYTYAKSEFILNDNVITAGAIFTARLVDGLVHLEKQITKHPHTIVLTPANARLRFAAPCKDLSVALEGSFMAAEAAYC